MSYDTRPAIRKALDELGVPGDDYPAPVANAVDILTRALHEADSGHALREDGSCPVCDEQDEVLIVTPLVGKVDQDRLYATDQGVVWAEEFSKVEPGVDVGLMIGWFANLAETAKALQAKRDLEKCLELDPEIGQSILDSFFLHSICDDEKPTPGELLFVLLSASRA